MHNFLPFSRQLNTDFYINIQLSTYCSDHFRLSSIFKFTFYVVCQCLFQCLFYQHDQSSYFPRLIIFRFFLLPVLRNVLRFPFFFSSLHQLPCKICHVLIFTLFKFLNFPCFSGCFFVFGLLLL